MANKIPGIGYTPDGSLFNSGNHNNVSAAGYGTTGSAVIVYTWSGLAASVAGTYTSGPSARVTLSGLGVDSGGIYIGNAVWLSFTALAPLVDIYTAAAADNETEAAQVSGSGDAFSSGFGSGTTSSGVCQVASGTGASPPTAASSLGDTVQQRIERCMGYGEVTAPMRCIDPSALLVQAGTDIGGQQTGNNVSNIVNSDGGLLYVDNLGYIDVLAAHPPRLPVHLPRVDLRTQRGTAPVLPGPVRVARGPAADLQRRRHLPLQPR